MKKRLYALALILLSFSILPLPAAITATYIPAEALAFTTVLPGYPRPPNFPPFADSAFVARLGTLTITATGGDKIYQPSLINAQLSSVYQFNGPINWNGPTNPIWNNRDTGFFLVATTSVLGTSGYQLLWGGSGTVPLTDSENAVNGSTFVANFYFVSQQNSAIYKVKSNYTLVNGSTGTFNVAVAPNNEGIYAHMANNIVLPVYNTDPPGEGPPPPPPVLLPATTPPLPFDDPENSILTVQYDFSIRERQTLNLPDGYLAGTFPIAKAELNLSNITAGTVYGINVEFSKLPGSTAFELRPNGLPSGYAIPYQLKFKGQTVVKDVAIPWTPLANGVNTQDILITGISPTVAEAAPSGHYIDTIVVTITPIE